MCNKKRTLRVTWDDYNESDEDKIAKFMHEQRGKKKNDAYTVAGVMIYLYGAPEKEVTIHQFSNWKREYINLYWKVKNTMDKLVEEGTLEREKLKKQGTPWIYRHTKGK